LKRVAVLYTGHLQKIFETGELKEISVCRDFRHTAEDGKEYEMFKKVQDKNYISDFDKEVKRIKGGKDDAR